MKSTIITLLLVALVGLGVGWIVDHRSLSTQIKSLGIQNKDDRVNATKIGREKAVVSANVTLAFESLAQSHWYREANDSKSYRNLLNKRLVANTYSLAKWKSEIDAHWGDGNGTIEIVELLLEELDVKTTDDFFNAVEYDGDEPWDNTGFYDGKQMNETELREFLELVMAQNNVTDAKVSVDR